MKRRAAVSSAGLAPRALSHVFLSALAEPIRAQPETNALKLGSRLAVCQPGSAENSVGS
jgi:hypothetical protein